MNRRVGIVRFLGTNCDRDIWKAVADFDFVPEWLWYEDRFDFKDYAALIVPGGFSYGDYLRSGALAAKSPVMRSVYEAASEGCPILGICNGFQILCESGLLPGALLKNEGLKFIDDWVSLKSQTEETRWAFDEGIRIPIAHGDGRYFIDDEGLKKLKDNGQIWLSYQGENPNGSVESIAGVLNSQKNVGALMPHPERAMKSWMGSVDGHQMMANFLQV